MQGEGNNFTSSVQAALSGCTDNDLVDEFMYRHSKVLNMTEKLCEGEKELTSLIFNSSLTVCQKLCVDHFWSLVYIHSHFNFNVLSDYLNHTYFFLFSVLCSLSNSTFLTFSCQ